MPAKPRARPATKPTKTVRADAQRNIDTLLEAAKVVFVSSGVDAPVREIAGHRFTPTRISETLLKDYDALVRKSPEEVARLMAA